MSASAAVRALAPVALGAALWLLPDLAAACPVCFQTTSEENRLAFLVTTALLTLLPLAAVGGLGAYLWWAARRREVSRSRTAPTA